MRTVYRNLGAHSKRVLTGPGRGYDNAVVSLGGRRRMVLTTDPVSMVPALGAETSAWLSVHLVASDFATCGLSPQFATFSFNFPPGVAREDASRYLAAIGRECKLLGTSIVAGHTGRYPGGAFTVVGAGSMLGFCLEGEYVDPSMARPGDAVLMTKGAAVEATAYLALSFPEFTDRGAGAATARRARAMIRSCSTVTDALTASSVGLGRHGVTSMHDATEGGVLGALDEMASACANAIVVEGERIHIPPECEAVCRTHGIDPLTSLSEGTLLITCNPTAADALATKLTRKGIGAYTIGRVSKGKGLWVSERGAPARRRSPERDGYWRAYARGVKRRLR